MKIRKFSFFPNVKLYKGLYFDVRGQPQTLENKDMHRSTLLSLLALVAVLGLSANYDAKAGEHEGKRRREAERDPELDLDKDGKLDHGEIRVALDEVIGALDADKDGKIDHGEQRKALHALREKLDANKDGKLDDGEFRRAFAALKAEHPEVFRRLAERIHHHRREHKKKD
jgi:hypothetical protein